MVFCALRAETVFDYDRHTCGGVMGLQALVGRNGAIAELRRMGMVVRQFRLLRSLCVGVCISTVGRGNDQSSPIWDVVGAFHAIGSDYTAAISHASNGLL